MPAPIVEERTRIHAMRMDGTTDTILIVWTDQPDGRRRIEYPIHNLISATDMMGQTVKSKDGHSGQARAEIDAFTRGRVYLLWALLPHDPAPPMIAGRGVDVAVTGLMAPRG